MGKRKEAHTELVDVEASDPSPPGSHKKHKKHKKKHRRRPTEDKGADDEPLESPKAPLKLKLKIGSQTVSSKNVVTVQPESADELIDVTDTQPWDDRGDPDPTIKTKKPGDETSDEEKEWLSALEKGELDDYGEISKGAKDPSLMTARQRAMKHGTQEHELLQLPTGYRQVELTEEQLKRREQRANKRKQMAQEKREKDKKQTIDRLLKKQESKLKGAAKLRSGRKSDAPKVTYISNASGVSVSLPQGIEFPIEPQKIDRPPPRPKCGVKGCRNEKKYACSKTGIALCSLQCYKKNLTIHKISTPGLVT